MKTHIDGLLHARARFDPTNALALTLDLKAGG